MWGIFLFIISVMLLCAVLFVPVRLRLSGAVEPQSGCFCLHVRWLLFQTNIWFDLCLLDPPTMTVLIRHGKALTVRPLLGGNRGEKPRFTESLRRTLRIKALEFSWVIGIREESALTALACGFIEQATLHAVRAYFGERADCMHTNVEPRFDRNILRLTVRGIAIAFPAQIMQAWLKSKKKINQDP